MTTPHRIAWSGSGIFLVFAIAAGAVAAQLPAYGAGALLYPARHVVTRAAPSACQQVQFSGVGVDLSGWHCRATSPRHVTIVYLHGVADNRGSAAGIVDRFTGRGFDVIAYDSRRHGASGGDSCTYGFFEKQDLRKVIDASGAESVILIGHSLGAAVALQGAADDARVRGVVAASTFSDLRTVAIERAPSFSSGRTIASAFARAERDGRFSVDAVSPLLAARRITAPVLLIHGEAG